MTDLRSSYKDVWTALSETLPQAVAHVIGEVDERAISVAAEQTSDWLNTTVGIRPTDVVLEIGCGIGRVGAVLAPRCAEWIGADVSPYMLEYARKRLAALPNVQLVEISGFDLRPVSDASVDVVYSTVVFMHLDEWERYNYICEAARVLRPGGRIFVDNFNLRSDAGWDIFEVHRQFPPHGRPAHISKSSTPQELDVYLHRAGFCEIQIREEGAWVQAYAVRPTDGTASGGIIYPPSPAPTVTVPEEVYQQELERLHTVVAEKNAHIGELELLVARIEHGRLIRLVNWIKRMSG